MNLQISSTSVPMIDDDQRNPEHTIGSRLHGTWLILAHIGWMVLVSLAFAVFVVSLPAYYDELRTLSGADVTNPEALGAGLRQLGISSSAYASIILAFEAAFVFGFAAVALLIASRTFNDGMGLFFSCTLILFAATFSRAPQALAASHPAWDSVVKLLSLLGFIAFFMCFYLFPDGRFVPGWTHLLVVPWTIVEIDHYFLPTVSIVDTLMFIVFLGLIGSCIYAQIYRYRNVSTLTQRQQTKWVVAGLTGWVIAFLAYGLSLELVQTGTQRVFHELAIGGMMVSALLFIPISLGVAVLRYRLFDIDIIINRALVYGTLTASVIAIYVIIVGYLGSILRTGGNLAVSLVATGIVAVIFHPLRERLQRGINRLMYGERDDPYAVLSKLGQRLETTFVPRAILPAVVLTVAETFKLPYVAVETRRGDTFELAAAIGIPVGRLQHTPLSYQGELVGRLALSPRDAGDTFSSPDQRLLDDLARQIGIAVHAISVTEEAQRLSADLQRSRERLVTAREEERLRLRRDLHDGLGPQLASVTMKAEAARDLLGSDPARAEELLFDVMNHAQTAVADIRRVVYALRPPALDALGLVGALRSHSTQFDHGELSIVVDASEDLPALSAAVEVAAYRIALEALNNVVRHASAQTCVIRIRLNEPEGLLRLEIEDDGRGLNDDRPIGVGLNSIRERASELGGSFTMQDSTSGGTTVAVCLPLAYTRPEA